MTGRKANKRLRLGEYPRVSRQGTREDERLRSPDFQRELMRSRLGGEHELVPYPAEIDVSGGKPVRVILDSIIEAIELGELDGVAVAKLDRLARLRPKDRVELIARIEDAGGVILSASENLDVSTPEGRFARDVFFGVARMELERAEEGFETAKANAIASGIAIMSTAPFGLRFNVRHGLDVVEHEAAVVVELFERRAAGASFGELADVFAERTGRARPAMSIRRMLENRVYLGELRYAELVNDEPGFDAIVDVELFDAVQAVNAERSSYGRRQGSRAQSLLAGVVVCAGCGGPLARKPKRGVLRYVCNVARPKTCPATSSIDAGELDAFVIERVLDWTGPAADELHELDVELPTRGDRAALEAKLARARAALIAHETDVELEDELGAAAYAAGRQARVQRVERLSDELDALGEQTELEKARVNLRQELSGAGELDTGERRQLLSLVLAAVVVRQAPFRGAPAAERVELVFADAAPMTDDEPVELVEQTAA